MKLLVTVLTSALALWCVGVSPARGESSAATSPTSSPTATQRANESEPIGAEVLAWAMPLARELSSSDHDVDRAIGFSVHKLLDVMGSLLSDAEDRPSASKIVTAFDDTAMSELMAPRTSAAAKLLYLGVICSLPETSACDQVLALNPMQNSEANNAFAVIALSGYRSLSMHRTWQQEHTAQIRDQPGHQAEKARASAQIEKAEAQKKKLIDQFKRDLSVALRWDDFGLIYKERMRRALKRHPLPDALLARMGSKFFTVVKLLPQEDFGALIGGNLAVWLSSSSMTGAEATLGDQKASMQRVAHMIINNPQSSMVSVSLASKIVKDHPTIKRLNGFGNFDRAKVMSPDLLMRTDWVALRPMLVKANTQGDVAALNDVFAWADAQIAKIPNKSADQIAREEAEHKAEQTRAQAQVQAQSKDQAAAVQAANVASKAALSELETGAE